MEKNIEKPVVLVTNKVYRRMEPYLSSVANIQFVQSAANEAELSKRIDKEDPIAIIIGTDKYVGPVYKSLRRGGLIARFGVGYDGVDIEKAREHQLLVTNTPNVLESTVSELTVFLAAEMLRKVGFSDQQLKKGQWKPLLGGDLNGKTWAILGLGKIGKKLSKTLALGFDVRVFGLKKDLTEAEQIKKEYAVEKVSDDFDEIVRLADIVSIHVPANADTYHYLNRERLQLLKPGAIVINTGRGSLIDEQALFDLLESGHLGGAGLDVFENEPYVPVHPEKDLRKLSNIVLTPHIGSSTEECTKRMAYRVFRNIKLYLQEKYDQMDVVNR